MPVYQDVTNPEEIFRKVLKKSGFQIQTCQVWGFYHYFYRVFILSFQTFHHHNFTTFYNYMFVDFKSDYNKTKISEMDISNIYLKK